MRSSTEVILSAVKKSFMEEIIEERAKQIRCFAASKWIGLDHDEAESIELAKEALKRELLDRPLNSSGEARKSLEERLDASARALLDRLKSSSLAPLQSPTRVKGQLIDESDVEASPTGVAKIW